MELKVIERKENPLLQRTEVRFVVRHPHGPTPSRMEVRARLASELGVGEELIVIQKMASLYGQQVASGIAHVYRSVEELHKLEPRYLLERGKKVGEGKEETQGGESGGEGG